MVVVAIKVMVGGTINLGIVVIGADTIAIVVRIVGEVVGVVIVVFIVLAVLGVIVIIVYIFSNSPTYVRAIAVYTVIIESVVIVANVVCIVVKLYPIL